MRRVPLALLLLFAACGGEKPDPGKDTLARERAAAHFKEHRDLARADLAPLVARKQPAIEDLVTAAAIEIVEGKVDACAALLERAKKVDPDSAAAEYLRGQLAKMKGDFAASLPHFRRAHELAPDDLPSRLCLAEAQSETGDEKSAEALYRSVVGVGLENGQLWYFVGLYRLARLLSTTGREKEAEPMNRELDEFTKRGANTAEAAAKLLQGELAKVRAPKPAGTKPAKPPAKLELGPSEEILPELAGARELHAWDVDGDVRPDLVAVGDRGVVLALARDPAFAAANMVDGPVEIARGFDVDNDADLDLVVLKDGKLALSAFDQDAWSPSPATFPELPAPPKDVVPVDYDHDGDVDLLLVGSFGARIWRNDAGTFADASEPSRLPKDRAFEWAIAEDLDGDNDVDFLLGGSAGPYLADSLREGKFADKTRVLPEGTALAGRPIVADVDGDARPDLLLPDATWLQQKDGTLARTARASAIPAGADAVDLDLDGSLDLVGPDRALLCAGTGVETEVPLGGASGPVAAADFDGDRTVDVAVGTSSGVSIRNGVPAANQGVRLSYRGARSNRRALGSIVEYRAGPVYRRIYWRGEPVLAGVGPARKLDVLRITWPNGIVQSDLDLDLGQQGGVDDPDAAFRSITEAPAQFGSCPFLYARNAEGVVFVSDVLGGTPLGLPAKPGVLVPFRHDEHVLVRGDELAPVDGFLELHLTEELREVTFLDGARLTAVDHPAGTEVQPNERFCFPPFPEPHLHTLESPIPPLSAKGGDGEDWTSALAKVDDVHASPFELEAEQFAGRAKPWTLELAFDREAVAGAKKLRLAMTGWLFWSDATASIAAAGAGLDFVPPTFEVPDGSGGWKTAGPPVGFPSGKSKTMVVDVTSILHREDPRIRIACNLRLYWDAIRLATDGDDAPRDLVELFPSDAKLWRRGFSAPHGSSGRGERESSKPERFDWDRLSEAPRWNQTPGSYTRYGECTELLLEVDDRYAMVGAGDALTMRFDARSLPEPREGFVRDWILHLDGWCKDADLNTVTSATVEPLPFHGMSAYPPPAGETFPHEAWRREWNTRPAHRWIEPLALEPQR